MILHDRNKECHLITFIPKTQASASYGQKLFQRTKSRNSDVFLSSKFLGFPCVKLTLIILFDNFSDKTTDKKNSKREEKERREREKREKKEQEELEKRRRKEEELAERKRKKEEEERKKREKEERRRREKERKEFKVSFKIQTSCGIPFVRRYKKSGRADY